MAFEVDTDKGKGKGKGKTRNRPEMNVTPLVDVVLVLLIIFMVVMPVLAEQFWVHLPKKASAAEEEPESADEAAPIVVSINRNGEIKINRDVYPDEVFATRLRRMLVAQGERRVYFDADDSVPFARAVQVMDMARGGGAAHIAVVTNQLQ